MAVVSLFLFVPGPARSAIRLALVRHCSVSYPLPSRTRICAGGPSTHVALRVPPPTPQILSTTAGGVLYVRRLRQDALNEAHVKAAQRAATLSAVEQCGLCALPQGFQDAQQSEQSQEHLSS
ncbi:hypothetical protein HZH66_007178 [Vespula vulgaris]|uniref:Uncharacterized protein n=1 Tax=Vespula vulgaris TaxID=7454 RepID=A0A834K2Y2_VESVU|nr:hypothetical protein HZH66_007178 [Vespula vulgaris]